MCEQRQQLRSDCDSISDYPEDLTIYACLRSSGSTAAMRKVMASFISTSTVLLLTVVFSTPSRAFGCGAFGTSAVAAGPAPCRSTQSSTLRCKGVRVGRVIPLLPRVLWFNCLALFDV
jgi:hypothetical protein